MRASEVGVPLFEMTFDRKVAEMKFRGREETMTEHLVKLLAFDVSEQTRMVWKKEIRNHLFYLSGLRLRNKKPTPVKTILQWLYLDPIDDNEESVINAYIMMHEEDYPRNSLTTKQIAEKIKEFYYVVANSLAEGNGSPDVVNAL